MISKSLFSNEHMKKASRNQGFNTNSILVFFSLIFAFIGLCLSSCTEEVQPLSEQGKDYFPTQIGTWIEYECDSIWQDAPIGIRDTFRFFRRDVIESDLINTRDPLIQRFERYKKKELANTWNLKDVWFQSKSDNSAERIEENVRYVKLKFPMKENLSWNGNLYNFQDRWNYKITKLNQGFEINGMVFDSTVTIEQIDSVNLVQRLFGKEIWAKHIGLIYKRYVNYKIIPGGQDSVIGTEYTYKVIGYGVE